MESSTVLAFRIFVMLACLIIVPMAAIFGSAFPDVVKSVLVDRIMEWSTGKSREAPNEPATGGFGTVAPATRPNQPTTERAANDAPLWGNSQASNQPSAGAWQAQPSPGAVQVQPVAAVGVDPQGGTQTAAFASPAGAQVPHYPGVGQPDPTQAALADAREPGPYPAAAAGASPQPTEQCDRFTAIQRRLREHGATYYLLETWGNAGELYRFHCKMAVGNNPNYTRHFEATDRDPLRAMNVVLERVEAWRAGRTQ